MAKKYEFKPDKPYSGFFEKLILTRLQQRNVLRWVLYALVLDLCFRDLQINYVYAIIYGVLGSLGAVFGDLCFSVIKRQMGIKDYGNLIPGHGGVLDRFDSMMIVGPLAEALILLIPVAVKVW